MELLGNLLFEGEDRDLGGFDPGEGEEVELGSNPVPDGVGLSILRPP